MPRAQREPRGSDLSDRQLARSVVGGHKVTFLVPHEGPITGYIFGSDDYHWAVVTPDVETILVHKSTPLVRISTDETYSGEPNRERMEEMVSPFRAYVSRTYFRDKKMPEDSASTRQRTRV